MRMCWMRGQNLPTSEEPHEYDAHARSSPATPPPLVLISLLLTGARASSLLLQLLRLLRLLLGV